MHIRRPHKDWARTAFECLLWRYGSAVVCHRGRGSGCNRPECAISPLGGGCYLPQHRAPELTQDWGNRFLEGTNKILWASGPKRKEKWPYKRLTQTWVWVSRSLWQRCVSVVACCRVGGTECNSAYKGSFEGGRHYLHYLHHSLVSDQTTGREHRAAHQQKNWINDLLSMAPPIRTRPSFLLSQSLPAGSFRKPLILNSVLRII